jgi:hypothetical protein
MTIQELIHKMETGVGARIISSSAIGAMILAMAVIYDLRAYQSFNSSEAMDAAQVARNLSAGKGFSTLYLRPFSIYLVQKHNRAAQPGEIFSTNQMDSAEINSPHPDLANAPVYPLALAGLMKILPMNWDAQTKKSFWSTEGHFLRYQPEFCIAIFNQILLLAVAALTFLLARKLFDARAAWLAAALTLLSDLMWRFSVSGLSTLLLLVIFLALTWCLIKIEELARAEIIFTRKLFSHAAAVGALLALGMLTRYAFGWLLIPIIIFLAFFGGAQRWRWNTIIAVVFALVITPWLVRNVLVSGTLFGTAGYAIAELPGLHLMQSLNPNFNYGIKPYLHKFFDNLFSILHGKLFLLGEGWVGILFFAGLLWSLRNVAARRMRYFVMMVLATFIFVQALGETQLSADQPEMNSENLLALLTPFIMIFGAVFFLILVNQIKAQAAVRYAAIAMLVALTFQPLFGELLSKKSTLAYPPYYPPEVQRIAGWEKGDELMMSDVPWAIAWYGQRPCIALTLNQSEFFDFNDYTKHISAIYFTTQSLDDKFFSDMARGSENSWPHFLLKVGAQNEFPAGFPLRVPHILATGLFLTDRNRLDNQ